MSYINNFTHSQTVRACDTSEDIKRGKETKMEGGRIERRRIVDVNINVYPYPSSDENPAINHKHSNADHAQHHPRPRPGISCPTPWTHKHTTTQTCKQYKGSTVQTTYCNCADNWLCSWTKNKKIFNLHLTVAVILFWVNHLNFGKSRQRDEKEIN